MVTTYKQIEKLLRENGKTIRSYAIESIGLFGSFARNESTINSDVDMIVTFQKGKKTFRNFMGLKIYLQDLLQREVDLVAHDNLRNELENNIMKEIIYVEGL